MKGLSSASAGKQPRNTLAIFTACCSGGRLISGGSAKAPPICRQQRSLQPPRSARQPGRGGGGIRLQGKASTQARAPSCSCIKAKGASGSAQETAPVQSPARPEWQALQRAPHASSAQGDLRLKRRTARDSISHTLSGSPFPGMLRTRSRRASGQDSPCSAAASITSESSVCGTAHC